MESRRSLDPRLKAPLVYAIARPLTGTVQKTLMLNPEIHDYEEDHLVPLCLAGAPQDPANLWPQPLFGEWNAVRKDTLEAKLCRLACDGKVPLNEAQREIATDWIAAYKKYIHASTQVEP